MSLAGLAAVLDRGLLPCPPPQTTVLPLQQQLHLTSVVGRYNEILQDFYATGGQPRLIDEMPATATVKHHVFRDLGFLQRAGLVLVLDLAQAQLVRARAEGPTRAVLDFDEQWNYVYQRAEDRRPAAPLKGMRQVFRYDLRNERGRWLVASSDPAEVFPPSRPTTAPRREQGR
jgi:hypothetical protein